MRASPDTAKRAQRQGRVVGATTRHRNHATPRMALNDAIRRYRSIDTNPALRVEIPPPRRPSPWSGPPN
jgi:hypothetical protein